MTILEERSWVWQGTGGPRAWQAAWDRTRELLVPLVPDNRFSFESDPERGEMADGAAGLATALYLLAEGRDTEIADVRGEQIEALVRRGPGETEGDVVLRWESRLRALGHDPEADGDPVSERWRILRTDYGREDGLDAIQEMLIRQGYGLLVGLDTVLFLLKRGS
ncbi:hypothetical protein ACIHAA_31365 [Streptomyces sp. NPDC052040]|uniref:hypothetical protein n=1 Tax=unclassified Streptomyces TaxID=2593676 RepID=UPI0037D49F08